METQRGIKISGRGISMYYLEIGIFCSVFFSFLQKPCADLAGQTLSSEFFFYVNCINPNIIPVQYSKSGGDDFSVFLNRGAQSFLGIAWYMDGTTSL